MTTEHNSDDIFEQFAHRAERRADYSMSIHKFRLALFALLGYVVIIGVLGVLVALVNGVLAASIYSTALLIILIKKKLIFLIVPAIWILTKSLWVKLEAPGGYRLTKKNCPQLFEEIDSLRRSLKALKIHEVILTADLNAAISQTPRLGVLGWQKNTLILGLELLLTLSPEHARAVVAHEFGHLSGNHSRFAGWIYRIRKT
jgi:Zn-dependent protease with chaperone function